MQIEIRSRNGIAITDELRAHAARRFEKVDKMVSDLARLELELKDEHNPAIAEHFCVDATLYLKGKTLRACDRSFDLKHAMHEVSDELYEEVRRQFDEKAIVDLTLAVIAINGWNRLAVPFRSEAGIYQPATRAG